MTGLEQHIEKLAADCEADRIYAAEDIGYTNDAAGVPPLLARLREEKSRAVREAIFTALRQMEDDRVIEGAVLMLDSDDSFLRNQSVEMLRTRGAEALPYLERAFREGDSDRRKFVIDVLTKLGGGAEKSTIYQLALEDADLNVVITAVESLGETRKTGFRGRVEELVSAGGHPMLLCACLEALAKMAEPASLRAVRERLGPARELPGFLLPSYLKLVGATGSAEYIADVTSLTARLGLEGPVLNTLTALRAKLGRVELPVELAAPLCGIVASKHSVLSGYEALRLLGGLLHDPSTSEFLRNCLQEPEKSIRIGALQALHEAGTEDSLALVSAHLATETDEEVLQACRWQKVS